jgi:peptidylprolyl isomerase
MDALKAVLPTLLLAGCAAVPPAPATPPRPVSEILSASPASDWRPLDPENTLYLELPAGRVVIELAPAFAPKSVANIRTLVRAGYFDGLAVIRSHDNYVAQWGDPDDRKPLGAAAAKIAPEFTRPFGPELAFVPLPDRDTYAEQTGFAGEFPMARSGDRAWLVHCYGMVGVGRGNDADSGNGSSLYAITGGPARLLDRNITVAGRVVQGIELLSALPRGTGRLGFYEKPEQRVPISRVRMEADLPPAGRAGLEVLRAGSATFAQVVEARRFRRDDWYKEPAGHVDVCLTMPTVRPARR